MLTTAPPCIDCLRITPFLVFLILAAATVRFLSQNKQQPQKSSVLRGFTNLNEPIFLPLLQCEDYLLKICLSSCHGCSMEVGRSCSIDSICSFNGCICATGWAPRWRTTPNASRHAINILQIIQLQTETNSSWWVRVLVIVSSETNHYNVVQISVTELPTMQRCRNYTVPFRSKVGTNKAAANSFILECTPFLLFETDVLTDCWVQTNTQQLQLNRFSSQRPDLCRLHWPHGNDRKHIRSFYPRHMWF